MYHWDRPSSRNEQLLPIIQYDTLTTYFLVFEDYRIQRIQRMDMLVIQYDTLTSILFFRTSAYSAYRS